MEWRGVLAQDKPLQKPASASSAERCSKGASSTAGLNLYLCTQRREDLGAGLFGRGEVGAAVLALWAIHQSQPPAIGAGFARGKFLHAQKRQEPGHAEQRVEHRPARLRGEGKLITPGAPQPDRQACQEPPRLQRG